MRERKDLTRWNRAGLSRFRYIDGNAIEYLEILREQLFKKFKDYNKVSGKEICKWLSPQELIPENERSPENESETLIQRQQRLSRKWERISKSYHQERRDWVWEISRSFARTCHMLTEHADAYANERYLGTATQWDSVRKLVEMLDYYPTPPASAYTQLVFVTKKNKNENTTGLIPKGFQVKYKPPDGSVKIIFETLEDLVIDPDRDELRPKGWNKSKDPVATPPRDKSSSIFGIEDKEPAFADYRSFIDLKGTIAPEASASELEAKTAYRRLSRKKINEIEQKDITGSLSAESEVTALKQEAKKVDRRLLGGKNSEVEQKELVRSLSAESEVTALKLEEKIADRRLLGKKIDEAEQKELIRSLPTESEVSALKQEAKTVDRRLLGGKNSEVEQKELVRSLSAESEAVSTSWQATSKLGINPHDVVMVCRENDNINTENLIDIAEAAYVDSIDKKTGFIKLKPGSLQPSWLNWKKGEAKLKVSPRWQRKCWLNGDDVIRTKEPHGFSKDAYISWQEEKKWRYAKVIEKDKFTMRVELDGDRPKPDTEIMMVHTFDGDKMPTDYQEIAMVNDVGEDQPPKVEPKKMEVVEPDYPEDIPNPVFKIKKLFPIDKGEPLPENGGGGGGLLPPASVPKVGTFLFPSPMLPMDLVKVAVDLLLSLGVMQIPSTGEFVLKGMPFGASLDDAADIATAAEKLVKMLDELSISAMWENGVLVEVQESVITDDDGKVTKRYHAPMYFELDIDCINGQPPDWLSTSNFVNSDGSQVTGLACKNGKLVNSAGQPIGYQPKKPGSVDDGSLVQFKLTDWAREESGIVGEDLSSIKQSDMELLLNDAQKDPSILFKQIDKILYDENGNAVIDTSTGEEITVSGPLLALYETPILKAVVDSNMPLYMFDGQPGKLEENNWVVGKFSDGLRGLNIKSITPQGNEDREYFSVEFSNLDDNQGDLKKVYTDFRGALTAKGATIDEEKISTEAIELEHLPDSLKVGDRVVLSSDEGGTSSEDEGTGFDEGGVSSEDEGTGFDEEGVSSDDEDIKTLAATIVGVDRIRKTIITNPPAKGFTKGKLKILANVVLAGHGELKPELILGSGNAALSNQEFTLEVEDVSFTPDATKSSGVTAALEVNVAGRIWEQVSSLRDSTPGDHHYVVRMTEEGYVKIVFGDGEYGRRLPTGKNNIRVRYRVGSGLAGNVPAGNLEKPVNPHPLVESIIQPLQASGGGDLEDTSSLRENAPPTILTLDRAVSLSDFSRLAASHSSIWQAKAYSKILHDRKTESVEVVVVPAGGIKPSEIDDPYKDIRIFLQSHALPGITVSVKHFNALRFNLRVLVRIKTDEFNADKVKNSVISALIDHFSLENRKLGQHLYLSEVYKVVEEIEGVENSICEVFEQISEQGGLSKPKRVLRIFKASRKRPDFPGSNTERTSLGSSRASIKEKNKDLQIAEIKRIGLQRFRTDRLPSGLRLTHVEEKIAGIQVIEADNKSTVIYLDTKTKKNPSQLIVKHEEYRI